MKKYLNILVSVSIAFPAFISFQAVADEPQQIPRIVVRPGPNPSDGVLTGVGLGTPVLTLPPIEVRPRPENPDNGNSAIDIPLFSDAIKSDPRFCKKPSEACADYPGWSSRMTAGVAATTTTPAVRSVCGLFGPGGSGACNTAVTLEAAELGCANTKAC